MPDKIPNKIKITESPRESFQASKRNLGSEQKVDYINLLLKAGFDTVDAGSFVSPKAVPALKDTAEVLVKTEPVNSKTQILVSVGNLKGAEKAVMHEKIDKIAFLFSVSPTFLKLNVNTTVNEAFNTMEKIHELCIKYNKISVVDLCLAFGNPYGDEYNEDLVLETVKKITEKEIKKIVLADTLACGRADLIKNIFEKCINGFPDIDFGFHLHSDINTFEEKVDAAYSAGCRSFDSVIMGLGGCPMSGKQMIGNLSTENLLKYCSKNGIETGVDIQIINKLISKARNLFNT